MLEAFDMPDTHESCGRRTETITAPQALSLLNDKLTLRWAQAFAARVIEQAGSDANSQVETAFRLAYGRRPDGWEKDTVQTFFAKQKALLEERAAAGQKLALPEHAMPSGITPPQAAALVDLCHMLVAYNELVNNHEREQVSMSPSD